MNPVNGSWSTAKRDEGSGGPSLTRGYAQDELEEDTIRQVGVGGKQNRGRRERMCKGPGVRARPPTPAQRGPAGWESDTHRGSWSLRTLAQEPDGGVCSVGRGAWEWGARRQAPFRERQAWGGGS